MSLSSVAKLRTNITARWHKEVTYTLAESVAKRRLDETIIAWVHEQLGRGRVNKYVTDHTGSIMNRTANSRAMRSVVHGCLYTKAIVYGSSA